MYVSLNTYVHNFPIYAIDTTARQLFSIKLIGTIRKADNMDYDACGKYKMPYFY